MVAGRDLCAVVDVAYKSLALKEEIACQVDEPIAIVTTDRSHPQLDVKTGNLMPNSSFENEKAQFEPSIRSGSCAEIGHRTCMEDEHICVDDLSQHLDPEFEGPTVNSFYGVFDGHGGADAAIYVRNNLLKLVLKNDEFLKIMKKDTDFLIAAEKAVRNAFLVADLALLDDCDNSSGTTVLIALILGRSLLVANAGDCRAVLCRRGRAVEMSRDHKPDCFTEKLRIEALGGFVDDGYLNGELSVARALGDWDMKLPKGSLCPLIAEPEFRQAVLTEEDEFLIIGCDGIWDVMTSECAVTIVRKELMLHNDPKRCSRELVLEALRRNTRDNLTVVVVCFSAEPPPVIERPRLRYCHISAEGFRNLQSFLEGGM